VDLCCASELEACFVVIAPWPDHGGAVKRATQGGIKLQTKNPGEIALLAMVLAMCLLVCAHMSIAEEFSADFVVKTFGEPLPVNGKVFVKNGLVRHEVLERGGKQITVVRPDKRVIWVINPDEKMYLEAAYQDSDRKFDSWTPEKEKQAKLLGKETVSGLFCKKYETVEDGQKIIYWISEKLLFPIKIEGKESLMEYKNITEGALADSLFEIPPDYESMTAPTLPQGMDTPKK
jgi:outer membrane lipoprotein-sorting protein